MSRMRRLLVFTENYDPGGGNRYLADFVNALPADVEAEVVSNRAALSGGERGAFARPVRRREIRLKTPNLRTRELFERFPRLAGAWARRIVDLAQRLPGLRLLLALENAWFNRAVLGDVLGRGGYDAAIAFNGGFPAALSCFDLTAAARRRGIRSAMSVVSMPAKRTLAELPHRRETRRVDRYIVNCDRIRRDLAATRGLDPARISVLHNCVGAAAPPRPRRSGGEVCLFGYVGRVQAEKGVYELLEAFSKVLAEHPLARLELHGKIYHRGRIEAAIRRLGIGGAATLAGPFEGSVYDVLARFDAFVFPSRWEGFPYSLLEAMNAGLPVVATRVGGVPELVRDGENGLLAAPRDPGAIAAAMARLAGDDSLRRRLGRAAEDAIRNEYQFDVFEQKVRKMTEHLLEEKP